jgi:hypothetical protein
MTGQAHDIIEGSFRVIGTRDVPTARPSPNRRRAIARMVVWNLALMAVVVALPLMTG